MSIRNIDIKVSSVEEQEKESRWAGMQYEDNAALVRFIVDEALLGSFGDSAVFRIDFNGTESGYSPSENLQGEEGIFSRLLPYSMTYIGEDIEAVLVVSDQNFEILTYPVTLRFTEVERDGVSEPAINSNISLMEESVKKMCDRTCAAAEDVDGMYSELREIYVPANEMLNAKNEAEELVRTIEQKLENGEFVGEQGPVGPAGPQGIQGAPGPIGPQGVQGEQGPQGAKGEKGDRGEQGIQGEKGDKGDKGEKGDTGAAGKDAVTDQTFDPESENAQSGIAIEERLKSKVLLDVTLTEEQAGASSVDIAIPNFELLKKAKYWHIHFSYPYSGEYAANTIWLNCVIHDINKTAYNSSISSSYNIKMPTSSNKGFLNIIAFNTQYADGMGMLETYYLPHHPWARVSAANSAATPRANNWHYPSYFADVNYPPYLEFTNSNGFIFEAGTRIYLEVIL